MQKMLELNIKVRFASVARWPGGEYILNFAFVWSHVHLSY